MMLRHYKDDGDYDVVHVAEPTGTTEHHAISGKIIGPAEATDMGKQYPTYFECSCGFAGDRVAFADHVSPYHPTVLSKEEREAQKAEYEAWEAAREAAVIPLLTDEFLQTLVHASRTCGWTVDMTEVAGFVEWCYDLAGKELPKDYNIPFDEYFARSSSAPT